MSERERNQVPPKTNNPAPNLAQSKNPPVQAIHHPASVIQNKGISPGLWQSGDIMQLQKTIGNRAVSQLMQGGQLQGPSIENDDREKSIPQSHTRVASNPVQRMVSVGKDLYLNSKESGLTKENDIKGWKDRVKEFSGNKKVADVEAENFIRMYEIPKGTQRSGPQDAVTKALNNCRNEFAYHHASELQSLTTLAYPTVTNMLQPKDMLIEKSDDLSNTYVKSKACALQALVNAGVEKAEVEDTSSPESWHDYYYKQRHMRYDEDPVIYQIYTELGLKLVSNQTAKWSDLKLRPGTCIFSSKGHNFCVEVTSETDPDSKYVCHDEPQKRQTRYEANLEIRYIWKKP